MDVSYYPGCTLHGTAREYGDSTRLVAAALGVELHEIKGWTCCGAASAHATSDNLAIGLAARNVLIADKAGKDLVVPCASCFQRLKRAALALQERRHIPGIEDGYKGGFQIRYLVDFIAESIGEKELAAKVSKPLKNLSPVCFYGCLTARPPDVTGAKRHEDPQAMDKLMSIAGAAVKGWSYKTDCCGGDLFFTRPDIAMKMTCRLLDAAREAGADCIVTGCPLCQVNLDRGQEMAIKDMGRKDSLPVFYVTELLALSFGITSVEKLLGGHAIDPRPLLRQKALY